MSAGGERDTEDDREQEEDVEELTWARRIAAEQVKKEPSCLRPAQHHMTQFNVQAYVRGFVYMHIHIIYIYTYLYVYVQEFRISHAPRLDGCTITRSD